MNYAVKAPHKVGMALTDSSDWLGYRHPDYALSLADQGTLRRLEHSKGWIIERVTPCGSQFLDAMGLYPLCSCQDWQSLPSDIEHLRGSNLVSLILMSDPLLNERERKVFSLFDEVRPFKTHYLAELDRAPEQAASRHHAYYARKAAREIDVEVVEHPIHFLDEWQTLYAQLVAKHTITDMRAFSRESFTRLLGMPGVVLFRALRDGQLVGAQIFLLQDDVAFAHLAAFTDEGYEHGASYILDWHALEHFRGLAKYLNWGGGSGPVDAKEDGLARYKRGWSTEKRISWLLGIVFDQAAYTHLCKEAGRDRTVPYFPAYRYGEFS